MGLRQGIKSIEKIIATAKPGENVTQEQYEIILSTLKMARNMQKLRCGVLVIADAIILSVVAGWVVKYGYDFNLGEKIQSYTVPINAVGLLAEWQMVKKLREIANEANAKIDELKQINLKKMFR